MKDVILMAIESSCDETACAVVKNGNEILPCKFYDAENDCGV